MQEQFLQLWQQDPASAAYNTPWGIRLQGSLDMAALQTTVRLLATRHLVRPWSAVIVRPNVADNQRTIPAWNHWPR
jgi:hypothetical protein